MPIRCVQNFIYRNLVKRPRINKFLDSFGRFINKEICPLYAARLTRNKSVLFASQDKAEIKRARKELLDTKRSRAIRAIDKIEDYDLLSTIKYIKNRLENPYLRRPRKISYNAVAAVLDLGMSPLQTYDLLKPYIIMDKGMGGHTQLYLPEALESTSRFLKPLRIHELFINLAEDSLYCELELFLKDLPGTIEKISEILLPEATADVLEHLIRPQRKYPLLKNIRKLLEDIRDKLPPDQIVLLIKKLNDTDEMGIVPNAVDAGLTVDKIFDLISFIRNDEYFNDRDTFIFFRLAFMAGLSDAPCKELLLKAKEKYLKNELTRPISIYGTFGDTTYHPIKIIIHAWMTALSKAKTPEENIIRCNKILENRGLRMIYRQ